MKTQTPFASFAKQTNQTGFATTMSITRIIFGCSFLLAGVAKFGDWSASGYLSTATGPFAEFFQSLAGIAIIDQFNVWGLIFIGLGLILGLLVRPASFFGAVLMILYYFAHFEQNTENGLIDSHIIYALIFLVFMSGGIGHMFGLDGLIWNSVQKKKSTMLKALFG